MLSGWGLVVSKVNSKTVEPSDQFCAAPSVIRCIVGTGCGGGNITPVVKFIGTLTCDKIR